MIRSLMVLVSVRVHVAVTQCKDDTYNLPALNQVVMSYLERI